MLRRHFLQTLSGLANIALADSYEGHSAMSIKSNPIELVGNWRESALADATAVIACAREACLHDLDLRSDRQPERVRVDDRTSGPPAIWLHNKPASTAWIIVDVGTRDWCKLAYQFGHELGHVVANSWSSSSRPGGPCQWVEEALVEAFSLRGLKRLAALWRARSPFPNDSAYADAILQYRDRMLQPDEKLAQQQKATLVLSRWFRENTEQLARQGGVEAARPAVPTMLALYEENARLVDDLGAMNRWPERTWMELAEYFKVWEKSCTEIGTSGDLPRRLRRLLF